jgi:pimeloyl-ACP methyl ester carboxylesterase
MLFDLLTAEEEHAEATTRHHRFNISMLAERLIAATRWISEKAPAQDRKTGYFGSSTGAAAALVAAAELTDAIGAVVSRGGRAELADDALDHVTAPTLLLVGANDTPVIPLNREAYGRLKCIKEMRILPGASHLFDEPGALEKVAEIAAEWFVQYLTG